MKTKRLKSEKQDCRCYHWNGKAFHETKTNRSLLQQKKQTKAITKGCRASSFYWNQLFKMLKLLYLDHWELMRFGKFYLLGVVLAVHPILIHNQANQLISRTQRPKGHWIHYFFSNYNRNIFFAWRVEQFAQYVQGNNQNRSRFLLDFFPNSRFCNSVKCGEKRVWRMMDRSLSCDNTVFLIVQLGC